MVSSVSWACCIRKSDHNDRAVAKGQMKISGPPDTGISSEATLLVIEGWTTQKLEIREMKFQASAIQRSVSISIVLAGLPLLRNQPSLPGNIPLS